MPGSWGENQEEDSIPMINDVHDSATVRSAIKQFITSHVRGCAPEDDSDLFAGGYFTSLFAMQLVTFIEKQLGTQVDPDDLRIENFRSIDAVTAFVSSRWNIRDQVKSDIQDSVDL